MDTTLLLFLEDEWKRVDLYEDIDVSLTIQSLDITDLVGRKTPYSKTFLVPGTSNNSNIFEHYYEVNGLDFNPLVKIPAVVQYRGTDIFNGVLRLNAVISNYNKNDFEVYLLSDVGDFVSEIKNLTLADLDYTDLLHELNYENVTLSWEAKNNDVDGLFGGQIIYPLINDGLSYQNTTGTTPDWSYRFDDGTGFDNPLYPVPITSFKPALRLRSLVDRIFSATTYELTSEFFDTDYFKSIYVSLFNNGQLGIVGQTAEDQQNLNIFQSYNPSMDLSYEGNRVIQFPFTTRLPGGYDPLNNFVNSNSGRFQAPYPGTYYFNTRFNYFSHDGVQTKGKFGIVVKKGRNPETLKDDGFVVYVSPQYEVGFDLLTFSFWKGSPNLMFSAYLNAGDYIGVFLEEYEDYGKIPLSSSSNRGSYSIRGYDDFGIVDRFPRWDLYNGPIIGTGNTVDVKTGVVNIGAESVFKSLINLFNLVVVQDEVNKKIRMEPYYWYFNEVDRVEKDWTQKLNLEDTYRVEPLSFDLSKTLKFQYELSSEEYLNKIWEDQNDYPFGRYRFVSDSNLLEGEQIYEIPFAATPTTSVLNAPNFIIPAVYKQENGWRETPYSFKPHLFFWLGNRYAYKDEYKRIEGTWYILSGVTSVPWTTYPCVSHLSSLDIHIPELVSDLSFGSDWDFFANFNNQPVVFSPYNLYDTWWREYVDDNYSPETRRLSARFFLKPLDLYDTKLTDKIYVKDSFYRIEKITDGSLIDNKLTSVSLIKERGGYNKIIPPSPEYITEPNQPYPALTVPTTFTAYTGTSITSVCNGTAPTTELLAMGSTPLYNLEEVWYDTGLMTMAPVPIGIYLRETGTTETFLVIDKQGRVIEQDC